MKVLALKVFALKVLLVICILLFFVLLIGPLFLERSPQEAALGNLGAIDTLVDKEQAPEVDKLETAIKGLGDMKASGTPQKNLESARSAIHDAQVSLEGIRAHLSSVSSEIKAQIGEAKNNLSGSPGLERAKGVKDQILFLLWPVLIVAVTLYVLQSQSLINFFKKLADIVTTIKVPGGLEIAFASAAVKTKQEDVLGEYRQQVIKQYDALASQYQIAESLGRMVKGPIKEFFDKALSKQPKFRCTIHVRDMLFASSVYQLVDYVGGKNGRGRAWSIRRGMIGRTWRREQDDAQGEIPKDPQELIEKWGFTREEAENSQYQTMLCHLIKSQNDNPVAMLYLDAQEANAFGTKAQMDDLLKKIEEEIKTRKLDEDLQKIWQQAQASAPLIEIYADHK